MKNKLEIVNLELGIDSDIKKPQLNTQTEERIQKLLEQNHKEQLALQQTKQEKQTTEDNINQGIQQCFKILLEREITRSEMLQLVGTENLISVMVRLNNLIKQRGDLWQIHKHKKGKDIYYQIRPK